MGSDSAPVKSEAVSKSEAQKPDEHGKSFFSTTAGELSLVAVAGAATVATVVAGRYLRPILAGAEATGLLPGGLKALGIAGTAETAAVTAAATESAALTSGTSEVARIAGTAMFIPEATGSAVGGALGSDSVAARSPGILDFLRTKSPGEVQDMVFSRFLDRAGDRYQLQGSYSLKLQGLTGRKPADLDFILTDSTMMKGTRAATSEAVLSDLQQVAARDTGDGLNFTVPRLMFKPEYIPFPAMRQAEVVASAGNQELLRFPLDVRIQPRTTLLPKTVEVAGQGVVPASTVTVLQPEEVFANKLFTYQNSWLLDRAPKDGFDLSYMVRKGVDSDKIASAMQFRFDRGFVPQAMSSEAPSSFRWLAGTRAARGQSLEQMTANHSTIADYFNTQILPKVHPAENSSMMPQGLQERLMQQLWRRTAYFLW